MGNRHHHRRLTHLFTVLFVPVVLFGQANFPWPVEPLFINHYVSGTFCEYRSTSANGHFHNGTDIPKADGSPVIPSGMVS